LRRVRKPSSSRYPPAGPRSAYTGTPAADSASTSRYTVRTDTSSSAASSPAVIRPRDWSSSNRESNRTARIPSFSAPPGRARALRSEHDLCSYEHMDRLRAIVDTLRTCDTVTVAELAARHGVSEMTIRRDLDDLARQGVVRRIRGGAMSLLLRGEEPPFAVREREAVEAKRRIGAVVASLIADGEAVLLDGGTTALEVARALRERRLTVMPLALQA